MMRSSSRKQKVVNKKKLMKCLVVVSRVCELSRERVSRRSHSFIGETVENDGGNAGGGCDEVELEV